MDSVEENRVGQNFDWQKKYSRLLSNIELKDMDLKNLVMRLIEGERPTYDDGIMLFSNPNLSEIAMISNVSRKARFDERVFFNQNIHINPTNICVLSCKFCAFRRSKNADDSYALNNEQYISQLRPLANIVDEVHSVGGLHPEWDVHHYAKYISETKKYYPNISIKALTAVEIKHLAKKSNIDIEEVIMILIDAGLDAMPGGGAEILDDEIRNQICNGKESSEEYLEIHKTAHGLGLPTNCTMLFGTVENISHRVEHIIKLRNLQDQTDGFQCFIPYPFLPDDSRLPQAQLATANEILRIISISRIMLDNIPHLKAYRMNIGDLMTELSILHGADDIDGTVNQESIMHLAGSNTPLNHGIEEMIKIIHNTNNIPVKRNTTYTNFKQIDLTKKLKKLPVINS